MAATETEKKEDALILVHLRNQFYRKKFYLALSIFLLCIIIIGFLIGVIAYLVKHPTHPLYFVTDSVSRLLQDPPRTEPMMSTDDAAKWAIEAVETAYSYDFVNYREQLQSAQRFFSDYGWQEYMRSLSASNNLIALSQRKMVFIAKVVDKPKLIVEGILGGAYAWKFQMPLLVTYLTPPYGDKDSFRNPILVTVVVQRQSLLTSYKGLSIIQMIGNLVFTPTQPTVSATPT
jgi:intracellular multiplication protein IcmL